MGKFPPTPPFCGGYDIALLSELPYQIILQGDIPCNPGPQTWTIVNRKYLERHTLDNSKHADPSMALHFVRSCTDLLYVVNIRAQVPILSLIASSRMVGGTE